MSLADYRWRDANAQKVDSPPSDYPLAWRVSAYGLIRQENKVLMVKDKNNFLFTTPGGGIEVNESIELGLEREIKEETGAQAQVGRLISASEDWFYHAQQDTYHHALLLFYEAQLKEPINSPTDRKITFCDFVELRQLNTENTNPLVMEALQARGWLQ